MIGAVVAAFLAAGGIDGAGFQIVRSSETLAGVQAPTQFLQHWQQVGSLSSVTPNPVPGRWSLAVGAPTRLSRFGGMARIDVATFGHEALVWSFNETVGMATSTELEITFHIQYLVGVLATVTTITVYVETQRRAPLATVAFTVFWDAGSAAGVTFVNQLEVTQACPSVGTCP